MPALVQVTRDGVVESRHHGYVAVATADGVVLDGLGDIDALVFPRSALKPLQAVAVAEELAVHGVRLPAPGLAIAAASHAGTSDHQIEAAYLLACARLDESALRCPPVLPLDEAARCEQPAPTALANNCSGKHAAFLWAHTAGGGDAAGYLDPRSPVQERVEATITAVSGVAPTGPGVDGCGAPAWRLSVARLAVLAARLAGADGGGHLAAVRAAMTARPDLVGGPDAPDTRLMAADAGVVAKRGAEGVLVAGLAGRRPVGVAVKIADGAGRAAAPVAGAVLRGFGATVPGALVRVPVTSGGRRNGWLEPTPFVTDWAAELP